MTVDERVASYRQAFGDWPSSVPSIVIEDGRRVMQGVWMFGQDYRNDSRYYGAYPGNFLLRLAALFPDFVILPNVLPTGRTDVLHAFSGSLPPGSYKRCDLLQPAEFSCSVYDLHAYGDATSFPFGLIVADPPYSSADAKKYGTAGVDRLRAMKALALVTEVGGFCCWLDTAWPMHSKRDWVTVGRIYIQRSTNHRVRLLSVFERVVGIAEETE